MDRKDRTATIAALVLVAVLGGFAIARSGDGAVGAYYYYSDSPDPTINKEAREFAIRHNLLQESDDIGIGKPSTDRALKAVNPLPEASNRAKETARFC